MIAQVGKLIGRWYSIPLLLLLWQVAVGSGLVESRLLPSPARVWAELVTEIGNGQLIYHASVTVSRALVGFTLAALVGIPFAAAMARSTLWRNLFEPIFFLGYPIPKIALFPVFTYIFGIGTPSKIAFTFLECLYPIVVTCYFGFRGIQTRLVWTAQNFGASRASYPATDHIARGAAEYLCRAARCAAGGDHRRRHHRDDRRLDRARLLHHDLEHAVLVCECLRRDHRDRDLRIRARSRSASGATPRRILATGSGLTTNE